MPCFFNTSGRKTSKMLAVRRTDFDVKDHARTSQRFAAWSLNEMGTCLEEELYDFQAFCNCKSSSSMHYSLVIMVTKLRPSSTGLATPSSFTTR